MVAVKALVNRPAAPSRDEVLARYLSSAGNQQAASFEKCCRTCPGTQSCAMRADWGWLSETR